MKVLYNDGHVDECPADEELHVIRHTAAHILAQAIKRLYPEADFGYGPATENGFYYDIDLNGAKVNEDDFPAIEAEMKKIVKENLPFKTFTLSREESIKYLKERGAKYKEEHIGDLAEDAGRSRTVHLGRLEELGRDVLQDARDLQHGVGDAHPDVDEHDHEPGQRGVGPEGYRAVYQPQVHEQDVHGTRGPEHDVCDHEGDELGNGDREHEAEAPEALGLGVLPVDDHGQSHPQDEVGQRGQNRPGDGPP